MNISSNQMKGLAGACPEHGVPGAWFGSVLPRLAIEHLGQRCMQFVEDFSARWLRVLGKECLKTDDRRTSTTQRVWSGVSLFPLAASRLYRDWHPGGGGGQVLWLGCRRRWVCQAGWFGDSGSL
jgi:hypothetical protein